MKIYSDAYSDDYAELPLIEVIESLGVHVTWRDHNAADITFGEKRYLLNLAEVSFVEEGKRFNLVATPPGGHRFHKVLDKELILSSDTMGSAFYLKGIRVHYV